MKYYPMLIGEDCEAAYRFKQMNVSLLSGPFNRIGIAYKRLIEVLETQFAEFFLFENLHIETNLPDYTKSYGEYIRVVEKTKNNVDCEFWHEFHKDKDFYQSFLEVKQKQNLLVEEFKNTIKYDLRPIMFIHKKTDLRTISDYEDIVNQYRNLWNTLATIRQGKPFKIAAVGLSAEFSRKWDVFGVDSYQIHTPKLWGGPDMPEQAWIKIINQCKTTKILL